jgi:hypothetical protein
MINVTAALVCARENIFLNKAYVIEIWAAEYYGVFLKAHFMTKYGTVGLNYGVNYEFF